MNNTDKNCLICNEEMVERNFYGQNKNQFTEKPKLNHEEHIIQNAIGGRLKSSEILCEDCGNTLNKEIDISFVKLFDYFTQELKNRLPKERNSNVIKKIIGLHSTKNLEIYKKNDKVIPKKPFYERDENKKELRIFAEENTINNYIKKVKKDVLNFEEYKIFKITEFEQNDKFQYYFSKNVEDFNDKFVYGLIKIVTEFAYLKGIKREELKRCLDTQKNKLIFTKNVIPFYPVGVLDHYFEQYRVLLEKNYPSHTLILYTEENNNGTKRLTCYIDLFSTFQYYIVINDSYTGKEVFETYYQHLNKVKTKPTDLSNYEYKELLSLAQEHDIDLTKIKVERPKLDDYKKFISKEINKVTADYSIDFNDLLKFHKYLTRELALLGSGRGILFDDFNLLDGISKYDKTNMLYELTLLSNTPNNYKQKTYKRYLKKNDSTYITFDEIYREMELNKNEAKRYGKFKFECLNIFVQNS
ncbi:HNH endonuclease [Polaribacter vadi]|uniref:HNH endonuclease n=1 Tax=Polaribacter TaxID=52959 RepID=UPI001C098563|nr:MULTISPECIES: HNH endonuclease [Polaribacter]MBU3010283.1 HNH endonuclease [Polaribacter vadi]MDO6740090.1 HNH endonuclease [Polaribacter sp. 1_MG-2023]